MKSTLIIKSGKFDKTIGDVVESLAAGKNNRKAIDSELNRATAEVVKAVVSHPVSTELLKGPKQEKDGNSVSGYGNLFSFIGFDKDDRPIKDIVDAIEDNKFRISAVTRAGTVTTMKISSPKMTEVWRRTPMPWLSGESWVRGIEEKGISGLGYYLNTKWDRGKSGWGVQVKVRVGDEDRVAPREYVAAIIRDTVKDITNRITKDIIS